MPTDREISAAAEVLAKFAQWDAAKSVQLKARAQLVLEAAERIRTEDELETFGGGHPGVMRR